MRIPRRPNRQQQQGAVAILIALSMTVMIGFVGLALDLGKLYVVKSELQNSADACALAAAQALTGTTGQQLAIGEAAGLTTAGDTRSCFNTIVSRRPPPKRLILVRPPADHFLPRRDCLMRRH